MSQWRILTFYPAPGGKFDILAGLRAWIDSDGRLDYNCIHALHPFDPATHLEPHTIEHLSLTPTDLDSLTSIVHKYDLMLSLDARWYGPGIQAASYHHAEPPIMFWSFDSFLWGQCAGGLERADTGLLSFARAVKSAYVVATSTIGYEDLRHRFVRDGAGYRFVLPPPDPRRGHGIEWVDVCADLDGVTPTGHTEIERFERPMGYMRHVLAETDENIVYDNSSNQ